MKRINLIFAACTAVALMASSCQGYDDTQIRKDIAELQKTVSALQEAVTNKYSVESVTETAKGCVITFTNGKTIEIFHGEKGEQGDSFFTSLTQDGETVTIVLTDGSVFVLQKAVKIGIGEEDLNYILIDDTNNTVKLTIPEISDIASVAATILSKDGSTTDVLTKSSSCGWTVKLSSDCTEATIEAEGVAKGTKALFQVSVVKADGTTYTSSKAVIYYMTDDAAYEEFSIAFEDLQKQWTMVYNSTANNTDLEDAIYDEAKEQAAIILSGIAQNMQTLQTWAEESYNNGTLAADLDEILGSFEDIQIQLTQCLNLFNDTVEEIDSNVHNLSESENANCYIVENAGKYCFNAKVAGNGVNAPSIAPEAAKLVWQTENGLITKVSYEDGVINFNVSGKAGSALIAATDAAGKVLWSWHIWKPKEALTSFMTKTGYEIASLNIGALESTAGSLDSYGMFYQWGRKDPFPAGPTLTGDTATMPADLFDIDGATVKVGYSSWYSDSANNLEYSIENPTIVLAGQPLPGSYKDWIKDENNGLWGNPEGNVRNDENEYPNKGSKSCYDPCPAGWRVPPVDVLRTATPSGGYDVDESKFDVDGSFNYGYFFNMQEGSSYFPASGRYYGAYGMLYGSVCGLWGNYWSNAPYGDSNSHMGSIIVAFQKTSGGASMSPLAGGAKSDAYPVRCIRDKK